DDLALTAGCHGRDPDIDEPRQPAAYPTQDRTQTRGWARGCRSAHRYQQYVGGKQKSDEDGNDRRQINSVQCELRYLWTCPRRPNTRVLTRRTGFFLV